MGTLDEAIWGGAALPILGLVSGFAPRQRDGRPLAMLQAYVDDSSTADSSILVLGGLIAQAKNWAEFSQEWNEYLGLKPRISYFKMSEAASLQGEFAGWVPEIRDERIKLLNAVILNHASAAFSCVMPVDAFRKAFRDYRHKRSPFTFLLFTMISNMSKHQRDLGFSEPIDFIFDQSSDQKAILSEWGEFQDGLKHRNLMVGSAPIFRDDKAVLPIQAADLIAWWARQRYLEQRDPTLIRREIPSFEKDERKMTFFTSELTEDALHQHRAMLGLLGFG